MPLTLYRRLEYRFTAVKFMHKRMSMSISTSVPLHHEEIADFTLSILAKALHRQRESRHLISRDFDKLLVYIQRVKVLPSGVQTLARESAIVEMAIRPECQGYHPSATRVEHFSDSSPSPLIPAKTQARWTAATAHIPIDPDWNRGRFSA